MMYDLRLMRLKKIVKMIHVGHYSFKTLTRNLKVDNNTLNWNIELKTYRHKIFQIFLETFFANWVLLVGLQVKQIENFGIRKI